MIAKFLSAILVVLIFNRCSDPERGRKIADNYLTQRNLIADHTIDEQLEAVVEGVNCIIGGNSQRHFVTAQSYDPSDSSQIMIIPFRSRGLSQTSTGFSDIKNHAAFISPLQIKNYLSTGIQKDTIDIAGYLGVILLHEFGHFEEQLSGAFDEGYGISTEASVGEMSFDDTKELAMTLNKRLELRMDSIAIVILKKAGSNAQCTDLQTKMKLAISDTEFDLTSIRLISHFGSPDINVLRDQAWTHPNMELRLAFMNFYLNPTVEKANRLNDLIFLRDTQNSFHLIDPRINQSQRKSLDK